MKAKSRKNRAGFTLIEMLAVVVIVAILAAILVPLGGKAVETTKKRRAAAEMTSIKLAVKQFYADHKYMPWTDPVKVGNDKWVLTDADQRAVMNLLTGSNVMQKVYLQIPEKSRPADKSLLFLDPWSSREGTYTFYAIGMDRNMDGAVTVQGTGVVLWDGQTVMETVLVYPIGEPAADPAKRMKTFDLAPAAP